MRSELGPVGRLGLFLVVLGAILWIVATLMPNK